MKRVLIAAPARQDARIFREYKKSIENLIVPEDCEVDTFFVVNNCPELIPCMTEKDRYIVCDTDEEYVKTNNDHVWTDRNAQKVGQLRNKTIKYAIDNGYDYWFSIDTDVILHPMALSQLLSDDKDIVSNIFFTKLPNGYVYCNAWMYDQYTHNPPEWKTPGLYQCGMTGACTLVKRKVLEAGVNYTYIPNIKKAFWGEDRHFCIKAAVFGFEMWVDTHYPAIHLFTDELYREYIKSMGNKQL